MLSVKRSSIALAALAAVLSHNANAAPQPGQWSGDIQQGTSRIPVRLTVQDGQRASLQAAAPANCDVPFAFVGEQNGTTVYTMRQNQYGGAFCDMQINGQARLTPTGDGRILLEMVAGQRNARFQGILTLAR
ncbi:MAG TPA: hypothetical protein VFS04_07675 [Alphaproteobacteria bacterium]|nr:hypothetical protein [Alphaproteobacteria bacterium]